MKATILKAFALPLAAFALASAGAVGTNTSKQSKADLIVDAYIHNPLNEECEQVDVNCELGTGPACQSGSFTAYGKESEDSCTMTLHRVE
ncbi:DUF6520 family protein [Flavobacterium johnsoniae]|uniref:Uncharacterized protein n=1 Tax=Flavobacterium johnsoniae (strain ATCC 17061 / DSM 2064 / JCM 8514 / BCRC 14874 / CCUG 350202 / NBRC 14942 / NCIMB 11054 / UW101) TaxID=376686 RepID=A5FBN1_FLAJ1|nr:DUF6520 family protein [Flavobacterium johnsoniae]ABQ07383.1 hypothetical protein Fjoh_4376 [Flavobacterium johnsoniae UW101]OXE99296.1 hypothetical protein B0A63_11935 [Flavobacterium johnsoniae UW101]WQG80781.1 DUF6520 family protein [Flavobacterium johnsoniae UW101]SHL14592.1 hypothetical protein SAMN05444146_3123 [Flavobacterium johnsoniae]